MVKNEPDPGELSLTPCLPVARLRECRLVEPDAPELKAIGNARVVIGMQRVYKLGEVLWRRPRPYR